jgi:hypothetical protein
MSADSYHRAKANEYTVKSIGDDMFELWHHDRHLATLTKAEAWPVMLGRVHPEDVVQTAEDEADTNAEKDGNP